jgi:hypothetical protein
MHGDCSYLASLDMAVYPDTTEGHTAFQATYDMNYNQCIGELLWAMITCRLDLNLR